MSTDLYGPNILCVAHISQVFQVSEDDIVMILIKTLMTAAHIYGLSHSLIADALREGIKKSTFFRKKS